MYIHKKGPRGQTMLKAFNFIILGKFKSESPGFIQIGGPLNFCNLVRIFGNVDSNNIIKW